MAFILMPVDYHDILAYNRCAHLSDLAFEFTQRVIRCVDDLSAMERRLPDMQATYSDWRVNNALRNFSLSVSERTRGRYRVNFILALASTYSSASDMPHFQMFLFPYVLKHRKLRDDELDIFSARFLRVYWACPLYRFCQRVGIDPCYAYHAFAFIWYWYDHGTYRQRAEATKRAMSRVFVLHFAECARGHRLGSVDLSLADATDVIRCAVRLNRDAVNEFKSAVACGSRVLEGYTRLSSADESNHQPVEGYSCTCGLHDWRGMCEKTYDCRDLIRNCPYRVWRMGTRWYSNCPAPPDPAPPINDLNPAQSED